MKEAFHLLSVVILKIEDISTGCYFDVLPSYKNFYLILYLTHSRRIDYRQPESPDHQVSLLHASEHRTIAYMLTAHAGNSPGYRTVFFQIVIVSSSIMTCIIEDEKKRSVKIDIKQ